MTITKVSESGARCGDHVYFKGKTFGRIHCWHEKGCCVMLTNPYPVYIAEVGDDMLMTHVVVTHEDFASGDFSVVPF